LNWSFTDLVTASGALPFISQTFKVPEASEAGLAIPELLDPPLLHAASESMAAAAIAAVERIFIRCFS
jgi:hypothetical protein